MPMLFYVKQMLTKFILNRIIVQTACMTKSNYIFLRALARFNRQNWQLDSFLLVFWWWFAVVCLLFIVFTAYRPKFWWWFVVVCGSLWWFAVVCGGLRWFVMVCGGLSYSHTHSGCEWNYVDVSRGRCRPQCNCIGK